LAKIVCSELIHILKLTGLAREKSQPLRKTRGKTVIEDENVEVEGITLFIKALECKKNAYHDWSNTLEIMKSFDADSFGNNSIP